MHQLVLFLSYLLNNRNRPRLYIQRILRSEIDDLKLSPESLDAALMEMSYHDLYYYNPEAGFEGADVPLFFPQLHAALKSGGKL